MVYVGLFKLPGLHCFCLQFFSFHSVLTPILGNSSNQTRFIFRECILGLSFEFLLSSAAEHTIMRLVVASIFLGLRPAQIAY